MKSLLGCLVVSLLAATAAVAQPTGGVTGFEYTVRLWQVPPDDGSPVPTPGGGPDGGSVLPSDLASVDFVFHVGGGLSGGEATPAFISVHVAGLAPYILPVPHFEDALADLGLFFTYGDTELATPGNPPAGPGPGQGRVDASPNGTLVAHLEVNLGTGMVPDWQPFDFYVSRRPNESWKKFAKRFRAALKDILADPDFRLPDPPQT